MPDYDPFKFSSAALAQAAGVDVDVVRAWRSRGILNGYGKTNGHPKYSARDLINAAVAYRLHKISGAFNELEFIFRRVRTENAWKNRIEAEITHWRDDQRKPNYVRVIYYTDSISLTARLVADKEIENNSDLWVPIWDPIDREILEIEAIIEINLTAIIRQTMKRASKLMIDAQYFD